MIVAPLVPLRLLHGQERGEEKGCSEEEKEEKRRKRRKRRRRGREGSGGGEYLEPLSEVRVILFLGENGIATVLIVVHI